MKLLTQWCFGLGLLVIALSGWMYAFSRHGWWGIFILLGIVAAIVAYMTYLWKQKSRS